MSDPLQQIVDSGQLAGAATLVWKNGAAHKKCFGWRDIERKLPVEPATIFRIASMTKPITSTAALMLLDEGRVAFNDSIDRYAPEFSHMRVLRSPDGPLEETDPAERPITFEDLVTHRAGLTYGDFHRGPIGRAYREALGDDIDSHLAPDQWITRLSQLPLIHQPGTTMSYGSATDLLGFLIARIEGEPLGAVLKRRIFDPLGMKDTGFLVPPDKRDRRAAAYGFDDQEQLVKRTARSGVFVEERPEEMTYESGGQGLWSTVDDYLRFARLFLGDGSVDGVRLLRPEMLARMMTNQLTEAQRASARLLGGRPFAVGRGFGMGVSVVLEPDLNDLMRRAGVGTVSWPGAFGGFWQADPTNGSILIFLAHNMVDLAQMAKGVGLGVWAAIELFQKSAADETRD
jgi:CubicO group peptidase (beta-lactamase class C family)